LCAQKFTKVEKVDVVLGGLHPGESHAIMDVTEKARVPYISFNFVPEIRKASYTVSMPLPVGTLETAAISFLRNHIKPRSVEILEAQDVFVNGKAGWEKILPEVKLQFSALDDHGRLKQGQPQSTDATFVAPRFGEQGLEAAILARAGGARKVVAYWSERD